MGEKRLFINEKASENFISVYFYKETNGRNASGDSLQSELQAGHNGIGHGLDVIDVGGLD